MDSFAAWFVQDDNPVIGSSANNPHCQYYGSLHKSSRTFGNSHNRWRRQALDAVACDNNVFIMEPIMIGNMLLQLKVSTLGLALSFDTIPWSAALGRSVSKYEFENCVGQLNNETSNILDMKRRTEFSTRRVIKFILDSCNGVPVIVSSSHTAMMNRENGKTSLMDLIVYPKLLSGSQQCHFPECNFTATAVLLDLPRPPKGEL